MVENREGEEKRRVSPVCMRTHASTRKWREKMCREGGIRRNLHAKRCDCRERWDGNFCHAHARIYARKRERGEEERKKSPSPPSHVRTRVRMRAKGERRVMRLSCAFSPSLVLRIRERGKKRERARESERERARESERERERAREIGRGRESERESERKRERERRNTSFSLLNFYLSFTFLLFSRILAFRLLRLSLSLLPKILALTAISSFLCRISHLRTHSSFLSFSQKFSLPLLTLPSPFLNFLKSGITLFPDFSLSLELSCSVKLCF